MSHVIGITRDQLAVIGEMFEEVDVTVETTNLSPNVLAVTSEAEGVSGFLLLVAADGTQQWQRRNTDSLDYAPGETPNPTREYPLGQPDAEMRELDRIEYERQGREGSDWTTEQRIEDHDINPGTHE